MLRGASQSSTSLLTGSCDGVPVTAHRSWYVNPAARRFTCEPPPAEVARFHAGLPGYAPTALIDLPGLAREWDVRRVVVKNESARWGLPAFKALGVSYALYRIICERAGRAIAPATPENLRAALAALPPLELVAATDGNHGRALARFARQLEMPAHVFVPEVVDRRTVEAIRAEGAAVTVLAEDYDTTVARAAEEADSCEFAVLVQDTAWPGYEAIPQAVVDGYATLFTEIDSQLGEQPALVVVPMGVGSLAQAAVTHYRSQLTDRPAALLGVEPDCAACVLESLRATRARSVATGTTVMAGLNCGTPSSLAWPFLRDGLDAAVTVSDDAATAAVTELAALEVDAGPCGAACLPAVRTVLAAPVGRSDLGLGAESTVVLLSTEARSTPG